MSSTNHTTNYNLPQFIGTDKPAWLGDVNPAMAAIDAQMKLNADAATAAAGAASTADTKAENAATAASNADTKAQTAQTTANGAVASINTLAGKFNISSFTSQNVSEFSFAISSDQGVVYLAQSEDGSIFKFYGNLVLDNPNNNARTIARTAVPMGTTEGALYGIKTNLQVATSPEGAYSINCAILRNKAARSGDSRAVYDMWNESIAVGADGYIYICISSSNANLSVDANSILRLMAFPCVYFNSNFGDAE